MVRFLSDEFEGKMKIDENHTLRSAGFYRKREFWSRIFLP